MSVLVDTSLWIDYFRGGSRSGVVDLLIVQDLVVTNQLVLAELVPALHLRRQNQLIELLGHVKQQPMSVDWPGIIQMQTTCLRNGVNGVGIPDLIIAQNCMQGNHAIFSTDGHFALIADHMPLAVYSTR